MRETMINFILEHDFDSALFKNREEFKKYLITLEDDHLSYTFDEIWYWING